MNETKSPNQGSKPSAEGSGSDTVSAAKISAGTSVGTVGQTAKPQEHSGQSATLASHTSRPMGGGAGATGAGAHTGGASAGAGNHTQSRGPEHTLHQDKSAGQGTSGAGARSGSSGSGSAGMTDQARAVAGQASETVTQVAGQVQEQAGELYEQAAEWAQETYEQAASWASDQYEQGTRYFNQTRRGSGRSMGSARSSVEGFVRDNPVLVGVLGLATGLILGALLPRTRQEDRTLGRWSDELRDQGMRYARDMTHRGREFVEGAFNEDDDPRFASHDADWRQDGQGMQRPGASGRFQNH